jgi:hypothetical protein
MGSTLLRERLATRSVAARYGVFLGLGSVLALAGLVIFIQTLRGELADRAWHLFHVNWVYFTGLTGGSFAFVAVQKVSRAKWSGVIIRFAEAAAFLSWPMSVLGFLIIFTVGYDHIFPEMHGLGHGKEIWLSHGFMFGRLAVGLGLLYWLGVQLVKADLVPDMDEVKGLVPASRRKLYERWTRGFDSSPEGLVRQEARIARLAPAYVVTYAIVFTMVAFDTIMALQPHWFSNLFGGWYFMGSFLGGHTLLALLMLHGRHEVGIADLVSPKQRHDLGKLCFGFSVFWTYLMWSQFLVIWYGNLPEETWFVFYRLYGAWKPVGVTVFALVFLAPFAGLLFAKTKQFPPTLLGFALVSLTGLWLERYLEIVPSVNRGAGPAIGVPEVGLLVFVGGLFFLAYGWFATRYPMVSPRLAAETIAREHH